MSKKMGRKSFTPKYRMETAKLVVESGRPISYIAAEFGVSDQLLGRWVKYYKQGQAQAGGELSVDERAELMRLRRENLELRKDNEFLGKAVAFFASKHQR